MNRRYRCPESACPPAPARTRPRLRAAAGQSGVPFNTLARVEKGDLPDLANFRRIVEPGVTPTSPTRPPATSPAWSASCTPASPAARIGPDTAARHPDLQARSLPVTR